MQLTLEHGASQESVDIAVVWLGNHQGQYLVHKIDSVPNINSKESKPALPSPLEFGLHAQSPYI